MDALHSGSYGRGVFAGLIGLCKLCKQGLWTRRMNKWFGFRVLLPMAGRQVQQLPHIIYQAAREQQTLNPSCAGNQPRRNGLGMADNRRRQRQLGQHVRFLYLGFRGLRVWGFRV